MVIKRIFWVIILAMVCSMSVMAQDFDQVNVYNSFVKKYDFASALGVLSKMKPKELTVAMRKQKVILEIFLEIENTPEEKTNNVNLSTELTDIEKSNIRRFYRNAQKYILENKPEVARDILIYILYINPDHWKAKLLLDKGLDYPSGSYKVFDVADRYFRRSETYFLGGNYLLAIQDLEVLSVIDKENEQVFKRLGSAYYMVNQKSDAVDAWATALFLEPSTVGLDQLISETKKQLEKEALAKLEKRKLEQKSTVSILDPQVMGVFKKQSQALEMANTYKQKGMKVLVNEKDDGKYEVIISKKELSEKIGNK